MTESKRGFGSDNHSGVHPRLLNSIVASNIGHAPSYGTDEYSEKAKALFKKHFGPKTEAHFVFNGTAANVLSLKAGTQSFQSVICSDVSHMNVDECGAPEALAGCKLIAIPSENGKISLEEIQKHFIRRGDQHFSQVKMISLTQPTELGTVYSTAETKKISAWAHANDLLVHVDGARLSNACITLNQTFSQMTTEAGIDIVSFGGTKNGFLFGEAILFLTDQGKNNFQYIRKQFCQLPSKSRFLAAQFLEYLDSNLWKEIAQHSCEMAKLLYDELHKFPELRLTTPPESNAIFPFIPKPWLKTLKEESFFYVWNEHAIDGAVQCRLMCSWDTEKNDIQEFSKKIMELRQNEIPTRSLS